MSNAIASLDIRRLADPFAGIPGSGVEIPEGLDLRDHATHTLTVEGCPECDVPTMTVRSAPVDAPVVADPLATVVDLLSMVADYIADGVAGPDAAAEIGTHDTRPVDGLTLLRELGGSDLSDGARMARMVDAITANLSAVAL